MILEVDTLVSLLGNHLTHDLLVFANSNYIQILKATINCPKIGE